MRPAWALLLGSAFFCGIAAGQNAVKLPQQERKDKRKRVVARQQEKIAQRANIKLRGEQAFSDKELRSQLKEQIATIETYGLSAARGDDVAFFLELFYRKHGYAKVNVHYTIESGDRLRLDIAEGPLVKLGQIAFANNQRVPAPKLFEYAVGPTRERYSKLQSSLPFVASDIEEGADLVHRYYVANGFLDSAVDPPQYTYVRADLVNVTITIHEGRQYFFGKITFSGPTIYDSKTLFGQMLDLLKQPYTEARLADIPRRLQTYYKARGYYAVKVDAIGDPTVAIAGKVPVQVTIDPGKLYYFDGVTVKGLHQLRPGYLINRFKNLSGKTYNPEVLDTKFRELMRSGLFNILQIAPTPVDDNKLQLNISAEEAKPQEFGLSIGYGSFDGGIIGIQYRHRDLFGYGRPVTTSFEYSGRGYKGEVTYQDPYLFETDFALKARLAAVTYDFDGYSKFELGGQLDLTRKITKQYQLGLVYSARHVEVTSAGIKPEFLGATSYFVSSLGFTQTLDLRESPFVSPRGLVADNTIDFASTALGSDIEFIRSTIRVSYYLPFGPKTQVVGIFEDPSRPPWRRWFERSSLALGARSGIIYPLDTGGVSEALAIPIDERFFNGGSTTVRSFGERELGPHDLKGNPIGGEFFTVFNAEYTFPIYGELEGAFFVDAGNLLPEASQPGLSDMRYGVGVGLRYKLPIGPMRADYGYNPDRHPGEDFGAFHFSFGFAF